MRRWILILLLIVYPFQAALAMADRCCVMTSSGLTHHDTGQGPGMLVAEPVFLADDDRSALTDPHCPACSLSHHCYLLSSTVAVPAALHDAMPFRFAPPFLASPPVFRPERPKWPAAAN